MRIRNGCLRALNGLALANCGSRLDSHPFRRGGDVRKNFSSSPVHLGSCLEEVDS